VVTVVAPAPTDASVTTLGGRRRTFRLHGIDPSWLAVETVSCGCPSRAAARQGRGSALRRAAARALRRRQCEHDDQSPRHSDELITKAARGGA